MTLPCVGRHHQSRRFNDEVVGFEDQKVAQGASADDTGLLAG
jgi:hypothetical protein